MTILPSSPVLPPSREDLTGESGRAKFVGRVIWAIVGSGNGGKRSIFQLAGLDPRHLKGVSEESPGDCTIAINPVINPAILGSLRSDHLTEVPAVRLRNANHKGVVLIAVPEVERNAAGQSLGTVETLSESGLMAHHERWADEVIRLIGGTLSESRAGYIRAFVEGLAKSEVASSLDQFTEVLAGFVADTGLEYGDRIRRTTLPLRLPKNCYGWIPTADGGERVEPEVFRTMFVSAWRQYADIPYLRAANQSRLDVEAIQARVAELRMLPGAPPESDLDAVADLLADQVNLRAGQWRASQQGFCESFDFGLYGKQVFQQKARKATVGLPERTRNFLEKEHPGHIDAEDRKLLDAMQALASEGKSKSKGGPEEKIATEDAIRAFFEKRHDVIIQAKAFDARLLGDWRKIVYPAEVSGEPDLALALLKGAQMALELASVEGSAIPHGARLKISVKHAEKESTWVRRDARVYALFRLEMQLVAGALGDRVELDLGHWLSRDAIEKAVPGDSGEARTIELEITVLLPEDGATRDRVRVFWNPCESSPKRSIALAWPEDIAALSEPGMESLVQVFHQPIQPAGSGDLTTMSLTNTTTFGDVLRGDAGRTAVRATDATEGEWFADVAGQLDTLAARGALPVAAKNEVVAALEAFRTAYSQAIHDIAQRPGEAYSASSIVEAAEAFGDLCRAARMHLSESDEGRRGPLRAIVEFGLASAQGSYPVALLAAWHPLRLLERRARALLVANLLHSACDSTGITADGLRHETADIGRALSRWHYAHLVSIGLRPYACVEDCGGYGLAVALDDPAHASQAIETSAKPARDQFVRMVKEYLALHPHEESNFATAIYNAESLDLPELLAESFEDLMDEREHLRCGMLITHDRADEVRTIFARQSTRLQGRDLRRDGGFLSRLRVGVRRGASPGGGARRPDNDMAFLHDVFSREAQVRWRPVAGDAADLEVETSLRSALRPRRRLVGAAGPTTLSVPLQIEDLPRAAAEYIDLCYVADEEFRAIQPGKRMVASREVSWDSKNPRISELIQNAHDLAEWVVSYDTMSTRLMLADAGIKVIRDVPVQGSDAGLLVSSREPSRNLRRVLEASLAAMLPSAISLSAKGYANEVLDRVVEVAGQKVLGASRSSVGAWEVLGLAAATQLVRKAPETIGRAMVWVSLDDSRGLLDLKGKLADTLAVAAEETDDGRFIADFTVVEAKCVSVEASPEQKAKSADQVRTTVGALASRLVGQTDPALARSWGGRILRLLAAKPSFTSILSDAEAVERFSRALLAGEVEFRIRGRSVVLLHNEASLSAAIGTLVVQEDPAVVQHVFGQQALALLLPTDGAAIIDPVPRTYERDDSDPNGTPNGPLSSRTRGSEYLSGTLGQSSEDLGGSGEQDRGIEQPDQAAGGGEEAHDLNSSARRDGTLAEVAPCGDHEDPKEDSKVSPQDLYFPAAVAQALRDLANEAGAPAAQDAEEAEAKLTAHRLQAAFVDFGMRAEFAERPYTTTPNGVIVRFRGNSSLTVKRIDAKLSELRTTHGLAVSRILEGLGEIGVFVAARRRRVVELARTWLEVDWPDTAPTAMTSFFIGLREDNGSALWLNLERPHGGNEVHAPHTLIAGETGGGKGVLMQNLLLQMISFNDPRKLRIRLIDPKAGVDYAWIKRAPHLDGGIVTDPAAAKASLAELVQEMESRYQRMAAKDVNHINDYNDLVPEADRLPRIVLIHDEMADWMSSLPDHKDVVLSTMTSLAVKARAAGIHVILITQRAANDAIPVGIRDNLGNRLVLKVAGEAGSQLALKSPGAERLLGKGHVAANLSGDKPDDGEFFVAQVPYATLPQLNVLAQAAVASWPVSPGSSNAP